MADVFAPEPLPDELALKQPYWRSEVVDARLHDTFRGEDSYAAGVILSTLVGEDPGGDPEVSDLVSCRLMLGAIKLSGGDLTTLALWVEVAREDPRDLIAAAEYRRQLHGEGPNAVRADLAEYMVWVSGDTSPARAH